MIRRVRAEPAAHCLAFASSVITLLPIHSHARVKILSSCILQGTTVLIGRCSRPLTLTDLIRSSRRTDFACRGQIYLIFGLREAALVRSAGQTGDTRAHTYCEQLVIVARLLTYG
jgi:hypothetical protein